MSELKPCPFCGGKAMLAQNTAFDGLYFVYCMSCPAIVDDGDLKTEESAIAAWERRTQPDAIEQAESLISTMKNNKKAILWLRKYGREQTNDK